MLSLKHLPILCCFEVLVYILDETVLWVYHINACEPQEETCIPACISFLSYVPIPYSPKSRLLLVALALVHRASENCPLIFRICFSQFRWAIYSSISLSQILRSSSSAPFSPSVRLGPGFGMFGRSRFSMLPWRPCHSNLVSCPQSQLSLL